MAGSAWVRAGCALVAYLAVVGLSSGEAGARRGDTARPIAAAQMTPQVRVLYVIPQDRAFRADYSAAVGNALVDLQGWYRNQLGGRTFSLHTIEPEVCTLPRTADYYAVDSWNKVFRDVQACAPVAYASAAYAWVLYVDIVHACNAPGRLGAGTTGLTMLPRQDMDGLIGARVIGDCGEEYFYPLGRYIGGAGHELGHAFGLPHPPGCDAGLPTCDWSALMYAGYVDYPGTYLRADEKAQLLASPFIQEAPPPLPQSPIGVVDTPMDRRTGVTGAIPFTGWALDDQGPPAVTICRWPVAAEIAPRDPKCGGRSEIYLGAGVFVDGARPDVEGSFPLYPQSSRAGWGYMLLTNMLPFQGNGTFVFSAYARDGGGRVTPLGTRTMSCANASAIAPFGTIDTPGQGETTTGKSYVSFGWALTPQPNYIPADGSTLMVHVDGVPIGRPVYNNYRPDIATAFPGLANSDGAVGYTVIDTTQLTNGLHTIVWTATDSAGHTEGLGSRFFRVANPASRSTTSVGAGASIGRLRVLAPGQIEALAIDDAAIDVRQGWSPDAPWRADTPVAAKGFVVRDEEVGRIELQLPTPAGTWLTGYLRSASGLRPLPPGARLDADTGRFTWSPGVGFVGEYDLTFVRWSEGGPLSRQEVRVVLSPKGQGLQ